MKTILIDKSFQWDGRSGKAGAIELREEDGRQTSYLVLCRQIPIRELEAYYRKTGIHGEKIEEMTIAEVEELQRENPNHCDFSAELRIGEKGQGHLCIFSGGNPGHITRQMKIRRCTPI